MRLAIEDEIAVDFIADDCDAVAAAYSGHTGEGFRAPLYADGVVGIAENHHRRFLAGDDLLETVEIHRIVVAVKDKRILDHLSAVALDHHSERMVYGGLDDDSVAGTREEVDRIAYAFDHTGDKGELFALGLEAVAALEP